MISQLTLSDILSFRPGTVVPMGQLTVLIGPNGSGKSNIVDCIEVMTNTPSDLAKFINANGGMDDWVYKGPDGKKRPTIEVQYDASAISPPFLRNGLSHQLTINNGLVTAGSLVTVVEESIKTLRPEGNRPNQLNVYENGGGSIYLFEKDKERRKIDPVYINNKESILAQQRDKERYPILSSLVDSYESIRIYRETFIGRSPKNALRQPERADAQPDYLESDYSNLGLVLNNMKEIGDLELEMLDLLSDLDYRIKGFGVNITGSALWLYLRYRDLQGPMYKARISDGTLRILALMAMLLNPMQTGPVIIEEPELGLNPAALLVLARIIKKAKDTKQVIITTHSSNVLELLTDDVDMVITTENQLGYTEISALNRADIQDYLETYNNLGELMVEGVIG